MDELAGAFAGIGTVHRSPYRNTYHDRPARSVGAFLDSATARRVAGEWRALRPDVVHLNKQNLEDGLDLMAAAERSGLPCVTMIHITQSARWLGATLGGVRDAVAARRLRGFRHPMVTTPEPRAESLRELAGSGADIRVIHNGVPVPSITDGARERRRSELGIPDDALLVLDVARLEPQKNPDRFLALAGEAVRSGSNVHFLWVGGGSLEGHWSARVSEQGLRERVHHRPWTEHPGDWMAAADGFLHTARFEGMPFAVLEALAVGLPVVLSSNLIEEIPPFRAEGIVPIDDRLGWLGEIADRERRDSLREAARRLHAERFSAEAMALQYEALYGEAIASTRP